MVHPHKREKERYIVSDDMPTFQLNEKGKL